MSNILRFTLLAISLLFSMRTVFAIDIPFTDIKESDPYYSAVRELYEGGVVNDNGDHLFKPTELMTRDFFVSLTVAIGCHKCETPTITDIISYQIPPFVDITKANPHYYCISYAKKNGIAQGYILDETGKSTCENKQQYMSSPFCVENQITRIEATAMLLRRAKLWDDRLNSLDFDKSLAIPDVTSYWYGYAKKGIEIGIIKPKPDGRIGQDDKITRGEFATMAARILRYTQCQSDAITDSVPLKIIVETASGEPIDKTVFSKGSSESLSLVTLSGSWDKKWTLTNLSTREVLMGSGDTYPITGLNCGTWVTSIDILNTGEQNILSTSTNTITIECDEQKLNPPLSLIISTSSLITNRGTPINFAAIVSGGSGTISYYWDFGDRSTSQVSGNTSHIYNETGIYRISLVATDTRGNVAQSSIVINIFGDQDTDSDGIIDTRDRCTLVYAQTPSGCPSIDIYNIASSKLGAGGYASNGSLFEKNSCLIKKEKTQGLLIGAPNCTQCPCNNTINISSLLRSCDIVFPTILSPTQDTIYSRGGFYLIP